VSRRARTSSDPAARAIGHSRWVTLSNRRRVLLDESGRVSRGLPDMFQGVHVHDLSPLGQRVRAEAADERSCESAGRRRHPRTFRTAAEAVAALLAVNPGLVDFLESECARQCDAYRAWLRRGRRGPKPLRHISDGRFDAIEIALELRGKRRLSSWLEAVFVTVPPSRHWEDFHERLQLLADATGLRLALPDPAERLQLESTDVGRCQLVAAERIQRLIDLARTERLEGVGADSAPDDDVVPF
jgi:hypothetical protein